VTETGRIRKLEFFGPKVITNITVIDQVNATRIFTIHSRKMPSAIHGKDQVRGTDARVSEPLRQELHAWGMARIAEIHDIYRELFSTRSDRSAQIAAPLLTIAEISGDIDFRARLTEALDRQKRLSVEDRSAEELLGEAIDAIIARDARAEISLPQIMNELALLPAARMTDPISQVPAEFATLRESAAGSHAEGNRRNRP
jgi:hypothetical protein